MGQQKTTYEKVKSNYSDFIPELVNQLRNSNSKYKDRDPEDCCYWFRAYYGQAPQNERDRLEAAVNDPEKTKDEYGKEYSKRRVATASIVQLVMRPSPRGSQCKVEILDPNRFPECLYENWKEVGIKSYERTQERLVNES